MTKLWPPVPRPVLVPRERPFEILRAGAGCTLTLVDAPAGSGKTTALAQWLAADADRLSACWLSIDRSDNDPARFWTYAIMALRAAAADVGDASLAALRGGADVATFVLPPLINEIAASEVTIVLVVDDYHLIDNPAIHWQVEQFLDHLPDNVQVVLSTRADPPLPLSRWRGRGQLAELRAADLRFSEAEASELLGRMRLTVEAEDVGTLVERTEGWAAGLSLAGLSLAGRDDTRRFVQEFAGTDRHVIDYLGAEVLAGLSPEAQHFLVQSSVLNRLSGELCDAVLERRGSARLLAELERSNAFVVPLGDTREWYRLHHLFGEVLRSELRAAHPGVIPALHRRASRWFAERGMSFEAIEHAVEARDVDLVAELLTPLALVYPGGGQAGTVLGWLGRVGDGLVATDPRLCLVAGAAHLVLGEGPEIARWLDLASQTPYSGPLPDGGPVSLEAGVATIRSSVTSGRLSEHRDAGRRAVELHRGDNSIWSQLAAGAFGTSLYWTGDGDQARPYVEQSTRSPLVLLASTAHGLLGMIAVDDGDVEAASRSTAAGERLGEEHNLQTSPPYGRVLLARGRVHGLRGDLAASIACLDAAIAVLRPGPYPLELCDCLLWLAQAHHLADSPDAARAALTEARVMLDAMPEPGILADRYREASRRLAGGDRDDAPAPRMDELSARELDVLRMLPTALSEAQIGKELFISYHTVHSHIRTIYRKLGTSSRAQTVERARSTGLLPSLLGADPPRRSRQPADA